MNLDLLIAKCAKEFLNQIPQAARTELAKVNQNVLHKIAGEGAADEPLSSIFFFVH